MGPCFVFARPAVQRVLVISYYFPPSGGPGVQRVLKTVKYLRDFGYEPTVLTVADGAYPQHDASLEADVPDGVEVHRTRALDPFRIYGRLTGRSRTEAVTVGSVQQEKGLLGHLGRWLRANVFLPDARVGWVPYAIREARRLHDAQPFDVILTSGPPHSSHLIGRALKRQRALPWVADFRDPWTGINFYHELPMSAPARRLDRRLEHSVLREADHITTVSPSWARLLAEQGERATDAVTVVHNGYDEADIDADVQWETVPNAEHFTLTYVGSLYGSRNPMTLWAALSALRSTGALERLRIRLVGTMDETVQQALAQRGLDAVTEAVPYVPHAEAITLMAKATLLLLVVEPFANAAGMITGKLYEYLATGRPVLALGEPEGDAARLLEETGGGQVVARDDAEAMAAVLREHYDAWAAGQPCPGASAEAVVPYTRRAQTGRLAAVLDAAQIPL
ncbi:MAG: glycosyltransferase family 4 protein [Rhodothermaceae bacterium]|nr:glycosyltransferase family 4 protein [Rhodothermaceae bacterium]